MDTAGYNHDEMPPIGVLICFEGGEGSGKSSVIKALAESLRAQGYEVIITREPGGSPSAERIRALVVTGEPDSFSGTSEALLFAAAHVEHVRQTIEPALEQGKIVLCDRWAPASGLAYQVAGRGVDSELLESIHRLVGSVTPDRILWFDVAPEIGLSRSKRRLAAAESGEDRFEKLELEFHRRVHDEYRHQSKGARWTRVDANRTQADVTAEVGRIVADLLAANLISPPESPHA